MNLEIKFKIITKKYAADSWTNSILKSFGRNTWELTLKERLHCILSFS